VDQFSKWRSHNLKNENGILVGADQTQEWILPWWWNQYKKDNNKPVAFVDFGLSFEKKDWCRERGELIPLRLFDFAAEKEEMDPYFVKDLEDEFGSLFWNCRSAWFKKPFACLQTPFKKTIWIDIDCEIRCNLDPLFEYDGVAMAKDQSPPDYPFLVYNSGVMVFERDLPLIEFWADGAWNRNGQFRGDQELLSALIAEKNILVSELPPEYNWMRINHDHSKAQILHWHGVIGKSEIRMQSRTL